MVLIERHNKFLFGSTASAATTRKINPINPQNKQTHASMTTIQTVWQQKMQGSSTVCVSECAELQRSDKKLYSLHREKRCGRCMKAKVENATSLEVKQNKYGTKYLKRKCTTP